MSCFLLSGCCRLPLLQHDVSASEIQSIVILLSQVRNHILSHHPAKCVLELHQLNEEVMLGIEPGCAHRRFEIEAQPFLNSTHPCTLRKIEEQNEIENNGRCKNRITAEKVDLYLHRIAEPAKNVYLVPSFFIVS